VTPAPTAGGRRRDAADLGMFAEWARPGMQQPISGPKGAPGMHVSDYLSAILVGAVIGLLGRLVLPGRQRIGVVVTFLIGVGAALLGSFVARWLNVDDNAPVRLWVLHWDWIVLAIQVGFAVIGVGLANMLTHTKLAGGEDPPRKRPARRRTRSNSAE
jgi:uncharacterized membrane protein YeaQ/YmgE (transglycosylase-associated protein family)